MFLILAWFLYLGLLSMSAKSVPAIGNLYKELVENWLNNGTLLEEVHSSGLKITLATIVLIVLLACL